MQTLLKIVLSLTLVLSFAVFPSTTNAQTTVTVASEIVNLREGPGLTYNIVKKLSKGATLTVTETSGDWLRVKDGRDEGWVANWLVSESKTATNDYYVVAKVDHLNIRQTPSVSSAVLGQLFTGNEANYIKQDGDWIQITYGTITGWVAKTYVTITSKNGTAAAEQTENTVQYFTISADAVNVRSEGNIQATKLGVVYKGAKYKVLATNNNWVQVQYENNTKAWIYAFYGTLSSAAVAQTATNNGEGIVTVIYNGTNIRQEASTASEVVERANAGQTYTIVEAKNEFYKIALANGSYGYVANWVVSTNGRPTSSKSSAVQSETKQQTTRKAGTLHGVTIVIDPGHGGNDSGTTGVRGTNEKDITILTADKLMSKLRAAGATVYTTRDSDVYVDLRKRVAVSHQVAADAFISLHYDANPDNSIHGFTSYYANSYQKELATYINNGMASKLQIKNRGVQYGNYLVLRENRQKAVLVELGFLSNANEERTITTDLYREQATLGIYEGLLAYFNTQLK